MWYLFILLLLLIALFMWPKSNSVSGYCSQSANYIKPQVVNNLITPEEAEHILETVKPKFKNSTILSGSDESIRKSETAWLGRNELIIKDIFERLSKQFKFNIENVEDLQVVKYMPGGFYNKHHDSCCDDNDHCRNFIKKSGQRVLTILMYLNDDFEDGHTNFINLGVNLKADKYGGIIFHPLEQGGNKCHPNALHKGTPVKSGVKYICNIWVREKKWGS